MTRFAPLLLLLLVLLMPQQATAQIMNIDLNNLGNACAAGHVTPGQSLFASRPGQPSSCDPNLGLFARFFCILETTLGLVLAVTFCAVRDAWLAPFGAMMMLFMAVTGVSFVTGIVRFSVKDSATILLKMALVTTFVMNADIAMEIAYGFFIGAMKTTVGLMTKGFTALATNTSNAVLPYLMDGAEMKQKVLDTVGTSNPFEQTDKDLAGVWTTAFSKGPDVCSLTGLLFALITLMPFSVMIFVFALITFLGFFARAAFGYIYALVMVTFLVAAMPIFVSFALFKTTEDLFSHWLRYIGSNVIQIFIVFAVMGFAGMLDITKFLQQVDDMIVEYRMVITFLVFDIPLDICSICAYPNFQIVLGAIPVIPDGVAVCSSSSPMPLGDIVDYQGGIIIRFIVINTAVIYILAAVMDGFMKTAPDMARLLGGASLVQTIGGVTASRGEHGITSPIHRGTENFEEGFKQSWQTDDADPEHKNDDFFTRSWRSIKGGGDALEEGAYAVPEGQEDRIADFQSRLRSINGELADRYENSSETLAKASENMRIIRDEILQGNASPTEIQQARTQYEAAEKEYNEIEFEARRAEKENRIARKSEYEDQSFKDGPDQAHASDIFDSDGSKGDN